MTRYVIEIRGDILGTHTLVYDDGTVATFHRSRGHVPTPSADPRWWDHAGDVIEGYGHHLTILDEAPRTWINIPTAPLDSPWFMPRMDFVLDPVPASMWETITGHPHPGTIPFTQSRGWIDPSKPYGFSIEEPFTCERKPERWRSIVLEAAERRALEPWDYDDVAPRRPVEASFGFVIHPKLGDELVRRGDLFEVKAGEWVNHSGIRFLSNRPIPAASVIKGAWT